jgi:hypothetical protein
MGDWLSAVEPATKSNVKLHLDEVDVRGCFGDRVFHLEPGVDLHEQEAASFWLDEKLHGASAAVTGRNCDPDRRVPDRPLGSFLEDG